MISELLQPDTELGTAVACRSRRLRRAEASEYLLLTHGLKVAVSTLAKYATVGGGPLYELFGRTPVYKAENLDAWATQKLSPVVASSSDARTKRVA